MGRLEKRGYGSRDIKREGKKFDTDVCLTTLYNYIKGGIFLNLTMAECPYRKKKKKQRKRKVQKRVNAGKSIEERPIKVLERNELGDWEMDTVVGGQGRSKQSFLVLTERKTRFEIVELMKEHVKATMRPEVLGGLGGFSGAFSMSAFKNMEKPTLVSGTDGVGTKLKLAFLLDQHDTVGIDCVAMCVNDIACAGGEPLFFLDYIACGKNYPEKIAAIVKGVAEGCRQAGAALIGGETAEHPGLMPQEEYDLAGFAVGVADEKNLITGAKIEPGDVLVGLASSGVHSNGFSLVRKVFDMTREGLSTYYEELGATLGEVLLTPTRIYVKALKSIKEAGITIKGCSHITGGGFYENIPRMLPEGVCAVVEKDSYPVPAIFKLLQEKGKLEEKMMYNTYNMGLGMVLAVSAQDAGDVVKAAGAAGEKAYIVGRIEAGEKGVTLC